MLSLSLSLLLSLSAGKQQDIRPATVREKERAEKGNNIATKGCNKNNSLKFLQFTFYYFFYNFFFLKKKKRIRSSGRKAKKWKKGFNHAHDSLPSVCLQTVLAPFLLLRFLLAMHFFFSISLFFYIFFSLLVRHMLGLHSIATENSFGGFCCCHKKKSLLQVNALHLPRKKEKSRRSPIFAFSLCLLPPTLSPFLSLFLTL